MSTLKITDRDGNLDTVFTVGAPPEALAEPWKYAASSVRVRAVHLHPACARVRLPHRVLPARRPRCRARRSVRVARGSPDDGPGEGEPARGRLTAKRALV
jgi:hypothetical protein